MNTKKTILLACCMVVLITCKNNQKANEKNLTNYELTHDVIKETQRTWDAYKKYAWGHDVLLPLSKSYHNWYEESLHISPIDAYSTLKVMGLDDEAKLVENYVIDSIDWDKDLDVKTFEVNIRILGGLLSMYEYTKNEEVLKKTEDFGKRMLKAFDSPTGIPYYWVNLKTGEGKGADINVAEAASYTFEMGILSYYTQNPVYYQAAKKATLAIFERTSSKTLVGERIDVETGEWTDTTSHICAGIDSYYEYLFKSWFLFRDNDLKELWDKSIVAINTYLVEESDTSFWYKRSFMESGKKVDTPIEGKDNLLGGIVTLYDAFFPAVLAMSGDLDRAEKNMATWDWLWNRYGLEPMIYDFNAAEPTYPVYDLNPEIIESAYYLYHYTKDEKYMDMIKQYWSDIKKYCRTDVAFSSIEDVRTMKKKDYMPTFFYAETLKYLYLAFSYGQGNFNFDDHIFNTEAHPFRIDSFNQEEINKRLGIN